jgi:glycosyltransferase involved in cell wall biosynthesis
LAEHVSCELITFGPTPAEHRIDRLRVRVLRPLGYMGGHPARPIAPSLPSAIGQADIVHVHQLRSPASLLAAMTARIRRVPTVVTDHGLQGANWGGMTHRLFDRFLTVSKYSAAELRVPPARTRVIYGGADPVRLHPDDTVRRDGVLFVGRLTPHKGVDVLIRALPPDAGLTVVGTGGHDTHLPERDYPELLRHLASGRRVSFVGPVDDVELAGLYRRAAVVAVPSVERTYYGRRIAVSELLGLSALEAMASGTPVVASRIGGLPEIIEDGVTGFVVPPGDTEALRARLQDVLSDPALGARLGARARECILATMTWDRCAARCLDAYAEIVGSPVRAAGNDIG